MAETPQGPPEPPPTSSVVPEDPAAPAGPDVPAGRYDANVHLILRRLADHQRTPKPKRWWQGG